MKVIGLTGGIGTGKSTASEYLRTQGLSIIDADGISRELTAPGAPLLTELEQNFGSQILKKDRTLDRKALAAVVFSDEEKRKLLEKLMHGKILEEIDARIQRCRGGKGRGVIVDAPLLFETGLDKKCDQVWLITADTELRIARVCARDGMTPEEVSARMQSQMDDMEKQRKADRIVDNSRDKAALCRQLEALLQEEGI